MFWWHILGVSIRGRWRDRSSSEQVWTCLQWWPPEVSSRGVGTLVPCQGGVTQVSGREEKYPGPMSGQGETGGRVGAVMSNTSWVMVTLEPPWTDRHLCKHYLPTTSFAGGNNLSYWRLIWNCHVYEVIFLMSMIHAVEVPTSYQNYKMKLNTHTLRFDVT